MTTSHDGIREGPLGIVITGSTRGLGYALAREYLTRGHSVVICSRRQSDVDTVVSHLRESTGNPNCWGTRCDVSVYEDVVGLADFALAHLPSGNIDHAISNAATFDQGHRPFISEADPRHIARVIGVNLIGSGVYVSQVFTHVFENRNRVPGGHLILMLGSGSRGSGTKFQISLGYQSAKSALTMFFDQLVRSINERNRQNPGCFIGLHAVNPGMFVTAHISDVVLNLKPGSAGVWNLLGRTPGEIGRLFVNKMEHLRGNGTEVNFVSFWHMLGRILTWWRFKDRIFLTSGATPEMNMAPDEMGLGPIGAKALEECLSKKGACGQAGEEEEEEGEGQEDEECQEWVEVVEEEIVFVVEEE